MMQLLQPKVKEIQERYKEIQRDPEWEGFNAMLCDVICCCIFWMSTCQTCINPGYLRIETCFHAPTNGRREQSLRFGSKLR